MSHHLVAGGGNALKINKAEQMSPTKILQKSRPEKLELAMKEGGGWGGGGVTVQCEHFLVLSEKTY